MTTKRNIEVPGRLVRAMGGTPTIDLDARSIEATVATRYLARDGGILEPAGIITTAFRGNPVVQALHGRGVGSASPVIGRCVSLSVSERGVTAKTQFADTELGREYAYLYGVNPAREVYMRAWSFGWVTLSMRWLTLEEARRLLGNDWQEDTVPPQCRRYDEVWVAERSEMLEYSAVPVGADREALSRAYSAGGVALAGRLVTDLDLKDAGEMIAELRAKQEQADRKLGQLEQEIQALRRDGAAAAARGDTAEILQELRSILAATNKPKG